MRERSTAFRVIIRQWLLRFHRVAFPSLDDNNYPRPHWLHWLRNFFRFFWLIPGFLFLAFFNNYYLSVIFSKLSTLVTRNGIQALLNFPSIFHVLQLDQLTSLLIQHPSFAFLLLTILLFIVIGYWAKRDQQREKMVIAQREELEKERRKQEKQHKESEQLVKEVQNIHRQLAPRLPPLFHEMEARTLYLNELCKQHSFVTLPIGSNLDFSLQAIFQPLKLQRDPFTPEGLGYTIRRVQEGDLTGSGQQQWSQETDKLFPKVVIANNSEEALKKSAKGRMVILGGPGTGKTTLLKSLVADQARKALIDSKLPIPLFISLPDLARSGKTFQEYLLSVVKNMKLHDRSVEMLLKAIEDGLVFGCLDSLDEVIPNHRPEMIRMINELASDPGNIWIVGSRFTEYKGGQFKRGQFTEWELQSMNHELRQQMAQKLLPEIYTLLQESIEIDKSEPAEFVKLLEDHPKAASWGENPLLFSIAAVVFARTNTLPTSRSMLYQQAIETVLEMREPDVTRRKLLQGILADIALELYRIRGRTFTHDDLLTLIPAVRERKRENWLTEEIVSRVVGSGVLEVVAINTYEFKHQTFQEYLAAVELAQRLLSQYQLQREETWIFVWSKRTYSRWTEILRLMVGVLVQEYHKEGIQAALRWLQRLVEQRLTLDGDPGYLGVALAMKSLAEIAEVKTSDWKEVRDLEEEIIKAWAAELFDKTKYKRIIRNWEHGYTETVVIETEKRKRLRGLASELGRFNSSLAKIIVERLLKTAGDSDTNTWVEVARTLGELGSWEPIEKLIDMLNRMHPKVNSKDVHRAVVESFGEHAPVKYLLAALNNQDWFLRSRAGGILVKLKDHIPVDILLDKLYGADGTMDVIIVRLLYKAGIFIPLDSLLIILKDTEQKVERRWEVVSTLSELGEYAPIEPLLVVLSDEDWGMRRQVAVALGELGERVSIEKLVSCLSDDRWQVRSTAVEALGHLDAKVQVPIDPLLKALKDEDSRVRQEAAKAFGKLGKRAPVEPLVAALHDGDDLVRLYIAQALGKLGGLVPVEPLWEALDEMDEEVRQAVAEVLGKLEVPERIASHLQTRVNLYWWVRAGAVQVLGKLGAHAPVELLVATLYDASGPGREMAVQALGELPEYAPVEPLIAALSDEDSDVRQAAVKALGKLGERVPLEPLVTLLDDKSWEVRRAAVTVLAKLGERSPVELLIVALDDKSWEVRRAAARALEALGERASVAPIVAALEDNNGEVRAAAARALGEAGGCVQIEQLLTMALHDKYWRARKAAIGTLGKLGGRVPMELLEDALHDDIDEVQRATAQTLGKLRAHCPVESLVKDLFDGEDDVRCIAAWALGELEVGVPLEPLLIALNDKVQLVREAAVSALEKLGERVPVEPLCLALGDNDWRVRRIVVRTLGSMGKSTPLEQLIAALHDEVANVRLEAVEALGKLGEQAPKAQLLETIDDTDPSVRAAIIRVLGGLGQRMPAEFFLAALGDSSEQVRGAAAQVLKERHPDVLSNIIPETILVLQGSETKSPFGSLGQYLIAETLGNAGQISATIIDTLESLLDWPYWQVRMKAAQALGKLRRNIPDPAIRRLLELRHDQQSQVVRESADDALAEILSLETGVEDD